MEQDQHDLLSVSSEISHSVNPQSLINITNISSDTISHASPSILSSIVLSPSIYDSKQMHDISLTKYTNTTNHQPPFHKLNTIDSLVDNAPKEIGSIAEREVTLNKFEFELKIKRTILTVSYLILFMVELIYFVYFTYWIICPLLVCLCWSSLLIFNTNLYQYLYNQALMRLLFILLISILNILTIISQIVIYSFNFVQMNNFDSNDDYSFKLIISFNILSLFCSFCIDINIIDYINREYIVYAYKIIFLGIVNNEKYKIEEINGNWITIMYTFQHPFNRHMENDMYNETDNINGNKCCFQINTIQPIGIWQRVIIVLFVIGMLGSLIFTINGIQKMQPYIAH